MMRAKDYYLLFKFFTPLLHMLSWNPGSSSTSNPPITTTPKFGTTQEEEEQEQEQEQEADAEAEFMSNTPWPSQTSGFVIPN